MSSTAIAKDKVGSSGTMVRRTVAVVDMVGYSTIAKVLEENISAVSVTELNRQIQLFMERSLAEADTQTYSVLAKTGDGIIVVFHHAEDAHHFARRVHLSARQHNDLRSERSAERWFRVGLATGDVHATDAAGASSEYAGATITYAVRLESAARAGEIVIDRRSFEDLSAESQAVYSAPTVVRGKRAEKFEARRYCVTECPEDARSLSRHVMTRRTLMGAGVALVSGAGFALWAKPFLIEDLLNPLPAERSVVVMAWPAATPEKAPFLSSLLEILRNNLSRVGNGVPQFFMVGAHDKVDGQSILPATVATILTPRLVADSWGAKLILAVFLVEEKEASYVALHVVDPIANSTLRKDRVRVHAEDPAGTTRAASKTAAWMLDLPAGEVVLSDVAELATLSPANRTLFDEASFLARDDNQGKIDEAIAKFQDLSMLVPNFALAYAETGHLFVTKHNKLHDHSYAEATMLFDQAVRLNPHSQRARLGQARVLLAYGRAVEALTLLAEELKSDPGNIEIMLAQATANRQLNNTPQQIHIYRELTGMYPEFWPAWNDLGKALQRQGEMDEAGRCYERASQIAPRAVVPMINLSTFYLQHDRSAEAEVLLKRAAEIAPNPTIFESLGTIRFQAKDYQGALAFYQKAVGLAPRNHIFLSDIGDCYERLGQADKTQEAYTRAAEILRVDLKVNNTDGSGWMTLAFYEAKIHRGTEADADIRMAERHGGTDLEATFTKARALALLGRTEEAKTLVLYCRAHGTSEADIQLALELAPLLSDHPGAR